MMKEQQLSFEWLPSWKYLLFARQKEYTCGPLAGSKSRLARWTRVQQFPTYIITLDTLYVQELMKKMQKLTQGGLESTMCILVEKS